MVLSVLKLDKDESSPRAQAIPTLPPPEELEAAEVATAAEVLVEVATQAEEEVQAASVLEVHAASEVDVQVEASELLAT